VVVQCCSRGCCGNQKIAVAQCRLRQLLGIIQNSAPEDKIHGTSKVGSPLNQVLDCCNSVGVLDLAGAEKQCVSHIVMIAVDR
jgi:hypothetical protein